MRAPGDIATGPGATRAGPGEPHEAEREFRRQHAVSPQATSQTNIDQANAQLASQTASVSSASAQVQIASLVDQTIQAAEDTVGERQAQVAQAKANLEQAQVNFSYTEIRAPQDGWITERNVDLGTFVQAGQQVFYIVTPQPWIVANFKEDQLPTSGPARRSPSALTPIRVCICAGMWTASRPAAARASRRSRRRTRPATSSRSCAACR